MGKVKPPRDPRGHSLRIYSDVYDSAAYLALSPHDVLAYLGLLRELKGYNNGDLSLPLTRAKTCGISHSKTLARSLRALCAVGLVAVTRKGGCTKGGQKLATLYRLTDRECFEVPAKFIQASKETNEWKRVTTIQQGLELIKSADDSVKKVPAEKKALGHGVPCTASLRALVSPKTRAPRDLRIKGLGHGVTMAGKVAKPLSMQVADEFSPDVEKTAPRAPRMPPLYLAKDTGNSACLNDEGSYQRLRSKPVGFLANLTSTTQALKH